MTSANPSLIFRTLPYSTRRTHTTRPTPPKSTILYGILPYLTFSLYINIILLTKKATQSSDPIKSELKARVFYPPNTTPRTTKSRTAPHYTTTHRAAHLPALPCPAPPRPAPPRPAPPRLAPPRLALPLPSH